MRRSTRVCHLLLIATLLLAPGCGRRGVGGPVEVALGAGLPPAVLWEAKSGSAEAVPLILLCAPGSDPRYWDAFASPAANEGYRVLVCPPPKAPEDAPRLLAAAQAHLGNVSGEKCVVLAESSLGGALLAHAADGNPLAALILVSPGDDPAAEERVKRLGGTPLLLVACENDTQAATAARALKDAATGYCEIQSYACGVRGADLLAAAPNVANQILAWLKPIIAGQAPQ